MSAPEIKNGYVNGSDILLFVGEKAVGSCTSHTAKFNSETKERKVKPKASVTNRTSGMWKGKSVVGLSISINAEGLRFYDETECGYKDLLAMWARGESVQAKCMERGSNATPYLSGKFIITDLEENAPANDDATYSISLDNDGEPDVLDATVITENPPVPQSNV